MNYKNVHLYICQKCELNAFSIFTASQSAADVYSAPQL